MFDFDSTAIVPITEALAIGHTKMTPVPAERPLEESRLQELEAEIDGGTFRCPTWAIAKLNGKEYRADGHHTATALVRAMERNKFPVGRKVQITYYKIETLEEDGSALFLRLDDSDAARNSTATTNAVTARFRELREVSPKFKVTIVNGIVYHLREFNKRQKDPGQRVEILRPKLRGHYLSRDKNYRTFAQWLNHWNTLKSDDGEPRKASNGWLLKRPEVVAEAMTNYFAHSEAAKIFWNYMLDDVAPKGHPVRELVNRFNDWRSRSRDKRPKPEQWRSAIDVAWKLFLQEYEKGRGKK